MKKNIKNYKLIQIFLAIISIFSISLFLLIFNLSDTIKKDLNNFNKNTNNTYRLSDTYFNEDEYNFINTSQALKQLILFDNYLEKIKILITLYMEGNTFQVKTYLQIYQLDFLKIFLNIMTFSKGYR